MISRIAAREREGILVCSRSLEGLDARDGLAEDEALIIRQIVSFPSNLKSALKPEEKPHMHVIGPLVRRYNMRVRRDPRDGVLVARGVAAETLHQDPRVVQRFLAVVALHEGDHLGCRAG